MTFQQKEKRVKPRDFKFTKLLFFWATVHIQFWSQSWKHLWLHCLAESKGCSLYIIIFPLKVATSPTTTSRLLLQPPGHVAAGLEGRGLGLVARHEHGVRNETQFWTVGVWTCCCCTPDSSAGDPMLSDWPILPQNSLQRADGDEKTQINSSNFFLGRMVPFPCSISGVRKGSQLFSQRSPLDTLEGGILHHFPWAQAHKRTFQTHQWSFFSWPKPQLLLHRPCSLGSTCGLCLLLPTAWLAPHNYCNNWHLQYLQLLSGARFLFPTSPDDTQYLQEHSTLPLSPAATPQRAFGFFPMEKWKTQIHLFQRLAAVCWLQGTPGAANLTAL